MRIRLIGFTRRAVALARNLAARLAEEGEETHAFAPARLATSPDVEAAGALDAWVEAAFAEGVALVFVSAAGIACRAVAPHLTDKFSDPAVVVTDELGRLVVPLASGHVGGANDLAHRIASLTSGRAFVSTATDLRGLFAVDAWATANDLAIVERGLARDVSAALIEGTPVGFAADFGYIGTLPEGLQETAGPELGILVSADLARSPWPRTLHLVPRMLTIGVGCRRGADTEAVTSLVEEALAACGMPWEAVSALHTIDAKADEPALHALADARGVDLVTHTAGELAAVPGDFAHSDFVARSVGVGNVCERAACAPGARLLAPKRARDGVTCALGLLEVRLAFVDAGPGEGDAPAPTGTLTCVGIGPGGGATMTGEARAALLDADVICGYTTYVALVAAEFPEKDYVSTGMRGEAERVRRAIGEARRGRRVALICSGDAGVYGMAGLALELSAGTGVDVRVVAGVTAATAAAALLGAPLANDWCSVSLSDLMVGWEAIERRLDAAAAAGFVICLYNPASKGRPNHLRRACEVLMRHLSPDTWCGIARDVGRPHQQTRVLTLAELAGASLDMVSIAVVGTAETHLVDGRIVTERGYGHGHGRQVRA